MLQADVNSTRINVKYKMTFDVILNDENDCETWRDCRDCFIQDVEMSIYDVEGVTFDEDSEHTNVFYISSEKKFQTFKNCLHIVNLLEMV